MSDSPTKRALLALQQMQSKLEALERAQTEPIAIIGMGGRFPGAETLAEFWQLLSEGREAITPVPIDRWDNAHYYSPDPTAPGKLYTQQGGFVPHLYDFDAPLFRISPREAASLDPQQRLLLEVTWEALEQANLPIEQVMNSATGLFIGICSIDYWQQLLSRSPETIDAYLTTGNTHSTAAGRLSYWLGATGPSLAIDTACASSLVAVHLACQSLRQQECDMAIVGGVNRLLSPEISINFCKAKMLSPADRCRSFDALADGFVRSEGCGVVILKRLSAAIAAGDRVQAVILGSATNHDGRTSSLTVPRRAAQQAVIQQALRQSRLTANAIDYLEAHGTATALGDAIELSALGDVFADRAAPLWLGSVKTNIGHTEAAAGMASLIKTVLALQQAQIPAHLHWQTPNPQINWDSFPGKIPIAPVPWPSQSQDRSQRAAGVSAFGFNGTNVHLILADAPASPPARPFLAGLPYLLPLSARSEPALRQLADRYAQFLASSPAAHALDWAAVCHSASTSRSHWEFRLAIVTATLAEAKAILSDFAAGLPTPAAFDRTQSTESRPISFQVGDADRLPSLAGRVLLNADTHWQALLDQLAVQYVQGAAIDWGSLWDSYAALGGESRSSLAQLPVRAGSIELPTYQFQRQPYRLA